MSEQDYVDVIACMLSVGGMPAGDDELQPDPDEVRFARRVIEAMGDGSGVAMVDGKMQDDATYKQCRVMVGMADMLAAKDPDAAELYRV